MGLIQQSCIRGDMAGKSVLYVADIHRQIQLSFDSLQQKMAQLLGVTLYLEQAVIDKNKTPIGLKHQRQQMMTNTVQQHLAQSQAVTLLHQQGLLNTTPDNAIGYIKITAPNAPKML